MIDRLVIVKPSMELSFKAVSLTLLVSATVLLSACGSSPEESADAASSLRPDTIDLSVIDLTEIPEHLSGNYGVGPDVIISIDADVHVPDEYTPVSVAAIRRSLAIEDIQRLVDVCNGENACTFADEWVISREHYQRKKDAIADCIDQGIVPREIVQFLSDAAVSAPEEEIKHTIRLEDSPEGQEISVYIDYGNESDPGLLSYAVNGSFLFGYRRDIFESVFTKSSIDAMRKDSSYNNLYIDRIAPDDASISMEEAVRYGEELIKTIGADTKLYKVEQSSIIKDYVAEKENGWTLTFTKSVGGLSVFHENGWVYTNPVHPPVSIAPYVNEYVQITIAPSGICSLVWQGGCIMEEGTQRTVELSDPNGLPLVIADNLSRMYQTHKNTDGSGLFFEVHDMCLGSALITLPDSGENRFVPAWYVSYREYWQGTMEFLGQGMIIFNAEDRTYIEPRMIRED